MSNLFRVINVAAVCMCIHCKIFQSNAKHTVFMLYSIAYDDTTFDTFSTNKNKTNNRILRYTIHSKTYNTKMDDLFAWHTIVYVELCTSS